MADEMDELDAQERAISPEVAPIKPASSKSDVDVVGKMDGLSLSSSGKSVPNATPTQDLRKESFSHVRRDSFSNSYSPRRQEYRSRDSYPTREYSSREYNSSSRDYSSSSRDYNAPSQSSYRRQAPEEVPLPTSAPFVAFVNHLHPNATEEDVQAFLSSSDLKSVSIKVPLEKDTNRPRGFCLIEFDDVEGLKSMIDLTGEPILGKPIRVIVADMERIAKSEAIKQEQGQRDDQQPSSSDSGAMKGKATRQAAPPTQQHYAPRSYSESTRYPSYSDRKSSNERYSTRASTNSKYDSPKYASWNTKKTYSASPSGFYRKVEPSSSARRYDVRTPSVASPTVEGGMFAALRDEMA